MQRFIKREASVNPWTFLGLGRFCFYSRRPASAGGHALPVRPQHLPGGQPCAPSLQVSGASLPATPHTARMRHTPALVISGHRRPGDWLLPQPRGWRGTQRAARSPTLASSTERHEAGAETGKNNFDPVRHFVKKFHKKWVVTCG